MSALGLAGLADSETRVGGELKVEKGSGCLGF